MNKKIELYYINEENNSDILTKNLGQVLFSYFCLSLGVRVANLGLNIFLISFHFYLSFSFFFLLLILILLLLMDNEEAYDCSHMIYHMR